MLSRLDKPQGLQFVGPCYGYYEPAIRDWSGTLKGPVFPPRLGRNNPGSEVEAYINLRYGHHSVFISSNFREQMLSGGQDECPVPFLKRFSAGFRRLRLVGMRKNLCQLPFLGT